MTGNTAVNARPADPKPPVVCFSDIAWGNKSNERARQILTRLAGAGHSVYYFACVGQQPQEQLPAIKATGGNSLVNVYTMPYKPEIKKWAGLRRWATGLRIAAILARRRVHSPILWFYHPMLFALGYSYADSAIVYDVTQNFTSDDETQDDLYFEELTLLAEADFVFADGPELKTHVHRMMADLTAGGGAHEAPHAEVHCLVSPTAKSGWDKLAADVAKIVSKSIEWI